MLALILVSMTAFLVADFSGSEPVYEMLLARSLAVRERISQKIRRRRVMVELIVGSGSSLDGKCVREAAWPADSLLVNVKRGAVELVPAADLCLVQGDYLYVLVDDQAQAALLGLTQESCLSKL
jgi:Trk K+ transport system NAD-binding subunit